MDETELVAVEDLAAGDLVDLEGDDFADPWPHDNVALEYEYAEVELVERETGYCTLVATNTITCGFPHGWRVRRLLINEDV